MDVVVGLLGLEVTAMETSECPVRLPDLWRGSIREEACEDEVGLRGRMPCLGRPHCEASVGLRGRADSLDVAVELRFLVTNVLGASGLIPPLIAVDSDDIGRQSDSCETSLDMFGVIAALPGTVNVLKLLP